MGNRTLKFILTNMFFHQSPSSVTPVCSLPSHLWTASDFLWGVHPGSSVCPAELWAKKVRAPQVTEQNLNESKLRKRTEKCRVQRETCQCGFIVHVYVTRKLMFLTFRRLPCGVVWEELCPALPVWSHRWKICHGTQLHLHQRMLQHTPVQQSCNTCYALLDWHITHTTYFIPSLVNRKILKQCERELVWHTWSEIAFTALK